MEKFIPPSLIKVLLDWALESEAEGLLRPAAIGKGTGKKRVSDIRSDHIYWLEELNLERGQVIQQLLDELQLIARQEFYLPAKRFECHFAKYERGSFYKRHRDRHAKKPGRLLTCVIYLTNCNESQGGQLVLIDKESNEHVIRPEPGKIIVFDSALEHEVTKSRVDRWSLAGWVRSDLHTNIRI